MPLATTKTRRAVDLHHIDFRTKGTLPESYDLKWGADSDTGCWRYDHTAKRHVISLSPKAFDTIVDKGITRGQTDLFKLIYEHEASHSLYTTKDLKALGVTLASEKIPWRLMNLFEDVRIERIWKNNHRDKPWRWTRWSKHPADLTKMSPTMLMFRFKSGDVGRRIPKALMPYYALPFFKRVWDYFTRIAYLSNRKADTAQLLPILRDWMKEFPETGDDTMEGEGLGLGDLADAIKADGGAVTGIKGGEKAAPVDDPAHSRGTGSSDEDAHESMISDEPAQARRVSKMLATAFRAVGPTKAPSSNPAKRLNIKGILRGDWSRPFIGPTIADRGTPHISLLFDGSGSMHAQRAFIDRERRTQCRADDAGRVLVRALSDLALKGHITGKVYLTDYSGVAANIDLPIRNPKYYGFLWGSSSSEGIGLALDPRESDSAFKEITSKSKLAIIYTDGCITDAPINRVALRAKGLYTVGVCCSSSDRTVHLKKHFDSVISRDSLFGLSDALVRFLRSRKF